VDVDRHCTVIVRKTDNFCSTKYCCETLLIDICVYATPPMSRYSNLIRNYTTCQYNFGYVAAYLHIPGAQKKRGAEGLLRGAPLRLQHNLNFRSIFKNDFSVL